MAHLRLMLVAAALCQLRRAQARRPSSKDYIWGTCSCHWGGKEELGNTTSCLLVDGWTCADRLSDGPEDADIEVTLGNLPPSTLAQDVYLQWWATYRSVHDYDPLSGPGGSSIYSKMCKAYPKYWSAAFNGGNVRVDESGAAVVRVRRPSTYYKRPFLSYPHVHFRVCKGTASAQIYHDSLVIEPDGLVMYTKSQDTEIIIASQKEYAGGSGPPHYDIPEPMGYLVVDGTTTPSSSSSSTPASTTTIAEAIGTQQGLAVHLDAAMEQLLLDALEFSPVYECLSDQLVFDHFSNECADQCPGDADLHIGQCVLPKQEGASGALLTAKWQLEVHCEDLCGKSMEEETLHNVRLSVAGHLDIPFQEVEYAALIWTMGSSDRRLNGGTQAFLFVKVMTERYDQDVGTTSLGGFLDNLGHASQLLGMEVAEATLLPDSEIGDVPDAATWTITSDSDPFAPAYDALVAPDGEDADLQKSLTAPLAVGLVAGALVCGAALGLVAWKLHRWRRKSHREPTPPVEVVGMPVEDNVNEKTAGLGNGATSDPKLAWS